MWKQNISWVKKAFVKKEDYHENHMTVSLMDAVKSIGNNTWEELISNYRWLKVNGYPEDARFAKSNLPGFVFGGFCPKRRRGVDMDEMSGIIILDLDGEKDFDNKEKYDKVSEQLSSDESVAFWFRSPTNGLKIAVMTDLVDVTHTCYKYGYKIVSDEMSFLYDLEDVDPATCDPARICYVSHDPEILKTVRLSPKRISVKARATLKAATEERIKKEKYERMALKMQTHEIDPEKQEKNLDWLRKNIGCDIGNDNRYTAMFAYGVRLAEIGLSVDEITYEMNNTNYGDKSPSERSESAYEFWVEEGSHLNEFVLSKKKHKIDPKIFKDSFTKK